MAIVSANGAATPLSPNYIINGAFEINQRGLSSTTATGYGFDRWLTYNAGGTTTTSAQTFALGSCPVPSFDGGKYIRTAVTGQSATSDWAAVYHRVEDVATGSGQTVTLSFYAKAASGTPTIAPTLEQTFGSGGSASVPVKGSPVTITTSWARYSATFTLPSLSGKTVGAGSYLTAYLFTSAGSGMSSYVTTPMIQNNTFDIWGVQLELGSVATPFRRNANSLQGELAACERYYWRYAPGIQYKIVTQMGIAQGTSQFVTVVNFPVTMRTAPTSIEGSNLYIWQRDYSAGDVDAVISSVQLGYGAPNLCELIANASSLTNKATGFIRTSTANGYIGFSAEL